jgi:hypothetical protein
MTSTAAGRPKISTAGAELREEDDEIWMAQEIGHGRQAA